MQAHLTAGDRKRRRQVRDEPLHDWINGASQNRIYRTAHTHVAQKSCAAGKDLLVGGLNVGVSSNDGRNFSVEEPAQRDFLAGSLSVYVHDDVCRLVVHLRQLCLYWPKRIYQYRL